MVKLNIVDGGGEWKPLIMGTLKMGKDLKTYIFCCVNSMKDSRIDHPRRLQNFSEPRSTFLYDFEVT